MSTMHPESRQRGFGLVAAMFVIIIIAAVIAAMARLAVTQNSTNSLAIQQARAYQAASAGLEWGLFTITRPFTCGEAAPTTAVVTSFVLDGFTVAIPELKPSASQLIEEEDTVTHYFYTISATAQSGNVGDLDYAHRKLEAVAEVSCKQ
ncbi:pilus assembly protein MshP [Aquipseudomonas ullengensis]|uniref:Pilus assembly protein MshP n=1 Tax=Aquipseudomonas ullengensis TaxID=2759166 RepID=A0A7W4LPI7_9GAMM|nr:pilus assembly protein MshP [Pseudomonas ullengensis]MBB2496792.1 pilus assembly protein MshP [Pseudomonas ullengensis]